MQRLPSSAVVNGGPAGYRPAVIELPDHGSHASAAVSAEVLHSVADGFRLEKLGGIKGGVKIIGVQESLFHVIHDFPICRFVALMFFHNIGKNIPVLRLGKGFHSF